VAIKKITKRWLLNSFGFILSFVVVIVVAASLGIRSYYYSNVSQSLMTQAKVVYNQMSNYAQDSSVDYLLQVRSITANFAGRDSMEMMLIDNDGKVLSTSSGFTPSAGDMMKDYTKAVSTGAASEAYRGTLYGENCMALTMLAPNPQLGVSAVRFVSALTDIDAQIILIIVFITAIGAGIIFFVLLSSSYFINSIIVPVGQVAETARKIARGDFNARLKKRNDDEVGQLCDAINNMAAELGTAEQVKNDFISSVSHELRTPLTAIKGWAETLAKTDQYDKSTYDNAMRIILGESDRLSVMLEELLDFSRMESGRIRLNPEKLDIVTETSDVVLMFEQRAARENVALVYDEPADFIIIEGDRNRLRQVFVNILDNAVKYSKTGGGTVTIQVGIKSGGAYVSFADNGIGIKEADLPNVKKKFYKGNSTRRGSGIGLAVATEIVEMHLGHLDIASTEGVGTTVTVTLPLKA